MINKDTIIIGIAGASASGKSLLANTIVEELGSNQVVVISEDEYYKDNSHLPPREGDQLNFDHPDAFDHDLLIKHLKDLQQKKTIQAPIYDFGIHGRLPETRKIKPHTIIVLEGILIFVDENLRQLLDIRIFMDTPLDICLMRRINRDIKTRGRTIDSVLKKYHDTVRPMYLQFIEPSKHYADICVPRGGQNRIAIEVIKSKMREILNVSV